MPTTSALRTEANSLGRSMRPTASSTRGELGRQLTEPLEELGRVELLVRRLIVEVVQGVPAMAGYRHNTPPLPTYQLWARHEI